VAATILIVEDEHAVARGIQYALQQEGYEVAVARSGEEGLDLAVNQAPDLVVLDVRLPGIDGFEVLRRLRGAGAKMPVLILTARDDEVDKVIGLELGADDYLVKPFGMRELAARIRAVMRRTQAPASTPVPATAAVQEIGRLAIDRRAQRVHLDGEEIALTAKEFDVLAYLAEDPGAVRRRTEILEHVWEGHWYGATKTVDAHVAAIRKKLGDSAWIEAVRGVGFRLGSP